MGDTHDELRSEGDLNLSPHRQDWQRVHNDAETARLLAEDAKYFLHQSLSTPCLNVLEACEGSYLIDRQGRRILDFHGNWVHQVGFRHPRVMQAIVDQLQTLPFCTRRYTNEVAVRLAKKLTELAPGDLNKVLFAPGGAEAMSMALKLARSVTGRHKTISMWDAFHGATLDAISIGGEAIFRKDIGPLMPGTEHVPPPNPADCPWDCGGTCRLKCADYIDYVLAKEGDVAAVIAETVRSTPYIPPVAYWQKVRAACDRHGALLILDEIPHALGRTGKMFTVEHYGIVPDMLVIGKGLGGAVFPLAALLTRERFDVAGERALGHFTHEKNPVACAAALATIEVIEEEGLLEQSRLKGNYALERLLAMRERYPLIGDVRGLGLMLGVDLVRPDGSRAIDEAERVMYAALSRGLSFKLTMGNIVLLVPPLTVSYEELDRALDILEACFGDTPFLSSRT
ncbi:MAG: aspartate aminotransferase family protein [Rhodothermales bacterium]|nr:aspartate aminotransferase family protein [Rhodothermales bacterium]